MCRRFAPDSGFGGGGGLNHVIRLSLSTFSLPAVRFPVFHACRVFRVPALLQCVVVEWRGTVEDGTYVGQSAADGGRKPFQDRCMGDGLASC